MFANRSDAGDRLAAELEDRGIEADVVLGIPRGALPVARPVADALEADLDVVVARKLGAPSNPELAVGAVASDASVWLNDDLVDRLGVSESHLEDVREREVEKAREKATRYRGDDSLSELAGKRAIVVDDGVATGATAIACLRQVREAGAERIVLAIPVGSPDAVADLESETDEVVALLTPRNFRAVGQFYRDFGQVTDEEAIEYLTDR
ncbi:phosphoribosyltransferase [Natronococcus sp.]|uniref:phosphoribosyltransferase n=1 Tax=Natronococcus sp. TaxID=35747 RepID=UPI0025F790B2|nr:phosphoribosyltransferase family protein [Natronococcus sp.]